MAFYDVSPDACNDPAREIRPTDVHLKTGKRECIPGR
jgi:hypothetical protein